MDYRTYHFSRKEKLRYGLEAALITGIIALCFYNSPLAFAAFPLVGIQYFREKGERLAEERRKRLKLQFKDAVQSMAERLAEGHSAEKADLEVPRN